MEKILFLCRHIVTAVYLRIIDGMLKNKPNTHFNKSWDVIFRPFRISVYFIGVILFAQLIADNIFHWDLSDYFFINAVMSFSATMYFWHLSLLLKDLENPESIFRSGNKSQTPNLNIPSQTLFILKQIHEQKMYENPLLSLGSVASKFDMSEEKFAAEFYNNTTFSFSSYINYLRLVNFEKNSNSNYSKETNILKAGFNTRGSYYQWEKRRNKLAQQIDPILKNFE
jgi:AraC-like DNA-binding protein